MTCQPDEKKYVYYVSLDHML